MSPIKQNSIATLTFILEREFEYSDEKDYEARKKLIETTLEAAGFKIIEVEPCYDEDEEASDNNSEAPVNESFETVEQQQRNIDAIHQQIKSAISELEGHNGKKEAQEQEQESLSARQRQEVVHNDDQDVCSRFE